MLLSRIEAERPGSRAIVCILIGVAIGWRMARQLDRDRSPENAVAHTSNSDFAHPEDIKAALRKQHGSLAAFENAKGLPVSSVHDVLRGKARQRIADAIAQELGISVADLLRITRPEVDRWIIGGAANRFRFRKARTERQP